MNTRELSEHYRVNIQTVYKWLKKGCPSHTYYHGQKKYREFDPAKVEEWLREGRGK